MRESTIFGLALALLFTAQEARDAAAEAASPAVELIGIEDGPEAGDFRHSARQRDDIPAEWPHAPPRLRPAPRNGDWHAPVPPPPARPAAARPIPQSRVAPPPAPAAAPPSDLSTHKLDREHFQPVQQINLSPPTNASSHVSQSGFHSAAPLPATVDMPELSSFDHPPGPIVCDECEPHEWQLLPDGLMYHSYVAGEKEPRFESTWLWESGGRSFWDSTLGGRVGVLRYGTTDTIAPQGWQIDLEGAVMARLDNQNQQDLEGADFRVGIPITWRRGPLALKTGYYHLSSHVGDEYLVSNPGFERINYVRENLLFGLAYDINELFRAYGEVAWAFKSSGGAEPLELQSGLEYGCRGYNGKKGAPFAAVNVHLREEVNFGGSVNVVAGMQWRGEYSDNRWRAGVRYYNGKSAQYSFYRVHEELTGFGLWYDY